MSVTIGEILQYSARQLSVAGAPTAALDARVMLRHRLGYNDAQLAARAEQPLAAAVRENFSEDVKRRADGEPVAYIIGRREFMGMEFLATSAALAPRPETEELTETALAYLHPQRPAQVLDMGAGGGAIGLSIARLRPQCRVTLADCSTAALALARQNAQRLQTAVNFYCGNWFDKVGGVFDLVVSNPPYIANDDAALQALHHEPALALRGGDDGLQALRAVIGGAPQHLRAGGVLLTEHGATQAAAVRQLFAAAGFCGVCNKKDLAGLPRLTLGVCG